MGTNVPIVTDLMRRVYKKEKLFYNLQLFYLFLEEII